MTETTHTPQSRAHQIAAAWKQEVGRTDFRPRVWAPEHGSFARVYSGHRSEYVQVESDLSVTRSQSRLSWGCELDDAVATVEG